MKAFSSQWASTLGFGEEEEVLPKVFLNGKPLEVQEEIQEDTSWELLSKHNPCDMGESFVRKKGLDTLPLETALRECPNEPQFFYWALCALIEEPRQLLPALQILEEELSWLIPGRLKQLPLYRGDKITPQRAIAVLSRYFGAGKSSPKTRDMLLSATGYVCELTGRKEVILRRVKELYEYDPYRRVVYLR